MVKPNTFDAFKDWPAEDLALVGVMHALQALALTVLDDDAKRARIAAMLEGFSEEALRSSLSNDQREFYLNTLSSVGIASSVADKL